MLIFVGLKMVWLNDLYGGKFPILFSLGIIGGVIAASVTAFADVSKAAEAGRLPARGRE